MPTLVTPRAFLLHVPKTGGSWATEAVAAAGADVHFPDTFPPHWHADLADGAAFRDRFTIAFVRHPLDWWRSYWGYRMRDGWTDLGIDDLAADDFNDYIARVLERAPGFASAMFERFVGPAEDPIDFIGRHEHLPDDLCRGLQLAGERFDERALRSHPRVNVNDYGRYPARYEPELAERLVEAERATVERFYWWDPMPERLLMKADGRQTHRAASPARASSQETLKRRAEGAELGTRNARAELRATRAHLERVQRELGDVRAEHRLTADALAALRGSRTVRLTRPLRVPYYRLRERLRRRPSASTATSPAGWATQDAVSRGMP